MKKLQIILLIMLVIFFISGCIKQNTTDTEIIPTKDLPAGLSYQGKKDVPVLKFEMNLYNKTTYFWYTDNKFNTGSIILKLYELKEDIGDRKIGGTSKGSSLTEETILIEDINITHVQGITYQENDTTIVGITDFYYIKLNNSAYIIMETSEFLINKEGRYDEYGLKLTQTIVKNLKKSRMN